MDCEHYFLTISLQFHWKWNYYSELEWAVRGVLFTHNDEMDDFPSLALTKRALSYVSAADAASNFTGNVRTCIVQFNFIEGLT